MEDEKHAGGRPPHKPTRPSREKVALRAAANWSREEISMEIGISKPTLDLYYSVELQTGWIKWKGRALDLLAKSAKGGNVSAQGKLIALIDQSNPHWTPNSGQQKDAGGEDTIEPEALGKKAQAEKAAETAGVGTEWGEDLLPGSKPN